VSEIETVVLVFVALLAIAFLIGALAETAGEKP
jgi:hypothetical protein